MMQSLYDRVLFYSFCYRRLTRAIKLHIFNKKKCCLVFQLLIIRACHFVYGETTESIFKLLLQWINLKLISKARIKLHVCKRLTITPPPLKKTEAAKTDVSIKLAWFLDVADPSSLLYLSAKKYSESLQNN